MLRSQLEASNATVMTLTGEISTLKATIESLRSTIASLEKCLTEKGADVAKLENRIQGLGHIIEKKSEKKKPSQPQQSETQPPVKKEWPRTNHGAKKNPHYELETIEHDVKPDDPAFVEELSKYIGSHDVTRYRMVPMKFIKDVYHIGAYLQDDVVYTGKAPLTPILNSCYDGSFIAGIAYLRYMKAMPVERIVTMFQDHGFDLNKATANKLLARTAGLFENLHTCLKRAVMEDTYHAGDETYHRVLVPKENPDDKGSKKGYVWSILGMNIKLIYYFYDDGSRGEDVLLGELDGCSLKGALQSDGLGVYVKVAQKYGLVKLSCFQHCRRKFYDLAGNPDADAIVNYVSDLYHQENLHRIGKDGWTVEDNLKWRREYAPPIMERLKSRLDGIVGATDKYPPDSNMVKAANYMLGQWPYLENIFTRGDYALDNNTEERMQRYISMSRRSSLFFGSHKGAERGAIFYSLACSCKLWRINFFEYLTDVLNKSAAIPNGAGPDAFRHLLPDVWKKD